MILLFLLQYLVDKKTYSQFIAPKHKHGREFTAGGNLTSLQNRVRFEIILYNFALSKLL